jgi:predicted nucleotidyltransferase
MHSILTKNIKEIEQICRQHKVTKLYAFGSVCTDKFNDNSDVDLIFSFKERYFDGYVDNFFELEAKLENLLKRKIDLVAEETLQNPYFISSVNKTKTVIYE